MVCSIFCYLKRMRVDICSALLVVWNGGLHPFRVCRYRKLGVLQLAFGIATGPEFDHQHSFRARTRTRISEAHSPTVTSSTAARRIL